MIHALAIVTAKPGQREAILAAFRANMPAVHAAAPHMAAYAATVREMSASRVIHVLSPGA